MKRLIAMLLLSAAVAAPASACSNDTADLVKAAYNDPSRQLDSIENARKEEGYAGVNPYRR